MPKLTVAAVISATAAALLIVSGRPSVWNGMRPATCLPSDCFCEAVRNQLVRQPVNGLSGLSFVGVGLLAWSRRRRRRDHTAPVSGGEGMARRLLATAAVLVGAGTVIYHASLTFAGQTLDVFGMYLLVTTTALIIVTRRWSLSARMTVSVGLLSNALLLALLIGAPEYRRLVFAGLVVIVIALEARLGQRGDRGSRQLFWLAAAVLGGGFVFWALDYARVFCSPTSWLQGHAVWHLCGAAAVWLIMRYYGSHERRSTA